MRGETGKECTSARPAEVMRGESLRRLKRGHAELRHQERMMRNTHKRAEAVVSEFFPMIDERLYKPAPGFCVGAQFPVHVGKIALQHDRSAIVVRVRERRLAVHPSQ